MGDGTPQDAAPATALPLADAAAIAPPRTDASPLPANPDAVFFDFDGTLVDSRVPFARSINHTLLTHGAPEVPAEQLSRFLGPPIHDTFAELMGLSDDESGTLADAVMTYRAHQEENGGEGAVVFEGIVELLEHLQAAGVRLAIATSKVIDVVEQILAERELRQFFEVVCGPSATAVRESKAVTLGRALEGLGYSAFEPSRAPRAVMIGDRHHDVDGAIEHGLPTIGVLWGSGTAEELLGAGAAAVVADAPAIPPLLGL